MTTATATTTAPGTVGPVNAPSWVIQVLDALGAPVNQTNAAALQLWARSEGTPVSSNNPLATTQSGFGGTPEPGNSAGVKNYPTVTQGVQATVATLSQPYLSGVVSALRNPNSTIGDIWTQINTVASTYTGSSNPSYPTAFSASTTLPQAESIVTTGSPGGGPNVPITGGSSTTSTALPTTWLVAFADALQFPSGATSIITDPAGAIKPILARGATVVVGFVVLLLGLGMIFGPAVVDWLGGATGSKQLVSSIATEGEKA